MPDRSAFLLGDTIEEDYSSPDLPLWLWLLFPPILLIFQVTVRVYDHALHKTLFDGELGVIELATPLVLLFGIGAGLLALRYKSLLSKPLVLWLSLLILSCIYFAGEEVSWGQHLWAWETPELMQRVNDQKETNLHNISSWLDQKPRLLLELWVLFCGVIYPLSRLFLKGPRDRWKCWFYPTIVCFPTAVLAIAVALPERLVKWFDMAHLPYHFRYSETQEYYFAVFLMLYLLSFMYRLRALAQRLPT